MIVEELFQKLSFGPYAALSAGASGKGYIPEQSQGQVISHANDGLLKLFTKFDLIHKEVLVEMDEITTNYHLSSRFSPHNEASNERRRYIWDNPEELFEDDVIRILSVYNGFGFHHPLNDDGNPNSVFTPQGNVLQVPHVIPGQILTVGYQARHPKLTGDLEQEIFLPEVLEEALVSYISYKKYTNMATAESTAKAQEYLAMYDRQVDEAIEADAVSTSHYTTNTRFEKRGFI